MAENIPEKIGKYHVLDIAGRGNMGIVYVGYDPFSDQDVAIKVCTPPAVEAGSSDNTARMARKMFFNEAKMAGVLDHTNIVKILDAGEDTGEPYIVMEYVEGGRTVNDHCSPDTLLPLTEAAQVITKCAWALDYAHRRGVVHRDIKPSNLMLSANQQVKIGDFGVAQHNLADTTQVLGVVGSPRYMSPEQIREETVSNRTDIYSLGVVMFEVLTGEQPFKASRLSALVYEIAHEAPPNVSTIRPGLPVALGDVVNRAMAKDPNDRYESAAAMARDISDIFMKMASEQPAPVQEQRFDEVRKLHFFNEFSDEELREVLTAGAWEHFLEGESVAANGSADEFSFCVVIQGDVRMGASGFSPSLCPGDCLGELAYLSKTHRTRMTALSPVAVLRITESTMEQLTDSCQLRFSKVFLRKLVERLSATGALTSDASTSAPVTQADAASTVSA